MWKKTVFVLSIHTGEQRETKAWKKSLNVLMLDFIRCTERLLFASSFFFFLYKIEGGCSLKVTAKQDCEQKVTRLNVSGCSEGANNLLPPTTN